MNDTRGRGQLLAKVAGDDDEADRGDDDDAADDGAAPIEESAAKPAEDKPAEKPRRGRRSPLQRLNRLTTKTGCCAGVRVQVA